MRISMNKVALKPQREKPIKQHHPWIFSGAIDRIDASLQDGDIADIVSSRDEFLGRGYVNRQSQIVVRLLTWDEAEAIDQEFWIRRLTRSISMRPAASARRLVNAEADGLPGLIIDQYNDFCLVQFLTLGIDRVQQSIISAVAEVLSPNGIYERSDVDVRAKEGLAQHTGVLRGAEPPDLVVIEQDGLKFWVDVKHGHKTGFYLDQRDNRRKIQPFCQEAAVLNLFAYSGGFSVAALKAGAKSIVNVDSSADALNLARKNYHLNELAVNDQDFVEADVFSYVRKLRAERRSFDSIIADPPKLAQSQAQIDKAARAYKDLNLVSMQLLKPGGTLITFSCSGLVSPDLFQKIIFAASIDAGRDVQIVEKLSQASDHPILLSFPESEYLKGLVCKVL
ncbi:MAG TPA: class I SAM-dependent rRNA methyltransferase, partial [Anaerolineae bacterium]|nr:class I SAM-dependent rRNA methyltransferase [Anaerolineae bacterium]